MQLDPWPDMIETKWRESEFKLTFIVWILYVLICISACVCATCYTVCSTWVRDHDWWLVALPIALSIRLCWRTQCLLLPSTSLSMAQDGRHRGWPTSCTMGLSRVVQPAWRPLTGGLFTTPLTKSWSFSPTSLVYVNNFVWLVFMLFFQCTWYYMSDFIWIHFIVLKKKQF